MTTVVILIIGFGTVLMISAIETDPKTGNSVSVLQTISDVWNNNLNFSQSSSGGGANSTGGQSQPVPGTAAPALAFRGDLVRHDVRRRYGR